MNWQILQDPSRTFSVVLFIQQEDVERKKAEIEALGKQRNVKLIVQPCPYEGIEFLYRVSDELIGHHVSIDKEVFWQAIALKPTTPPDAFSNISKSHYDYLCAILEQDVKKVRNARKALQNLAQYFA